MTHKRIKQLMITSLAGLVLAGFSSCSQTEILEREPQVVDELVSPSLDGITFSFRFSGQDPKEVNTRAETIHDRAEWTVDQLQVFVFDREGKFIERVEVAKNKIQGDDSNPTYTYNPAGVLADRRDKVLQFLFLANSQAITTDLTEGNTTVENLKDRVLAAQQTAEATSILTAKSGSGALSEYYIPMMAMAELDGGNTLIPFTRGIIPKVNLKRIVARIDIINRIPELVIKKISLHKAFLKSRIGESNDETTRFTGEVKPFTALPNEGLKGVRNGEGAKLAKAFYLYEGKNTDSECVYVKLEATLQGAARVYHIPFKKKAFGDAVASEIVDVKRNHIYKIELGAISGDDEISFSFRDEPWNMHTLYEQFLPINGEAISGTTAGVTYKSTGVNMGELHFPKTGGTAVLRLSSIFMDHTHFTYDNVKPSWVTSAELSSSPAKTMTFTVKASNNGTSEQNTGKLVIESNNGKKLTISLVQEKGA